MFETKKIGAIWARVKPLAIALGIGLVIGPFISNYMGWQVTSTAARAQAHVSVVEQRALICEARARLEVKEPGKLDSNARGELAKKMSTLPGVPEPNWELTSACASKLAA
jgi:hypothetical protein